jgi:hypothetical protein
VVAEVVVVVASAVQQAVQAEVREWVLAPPVIRLQIQVTGAAAVIRQVRLELRGL